MTVMVIALASHALARGQANPVAETTADPVYLAVKTNLLYDAMLVPNAELELAIGKHWSIQAEWAGTKIMRQSQGNVFQLHEYGMEARYWFDNSWTSPSQQNASAFLPLHGFFAGAYYSRCGFDLEHDYRGCQDPDCWSAGISGGYSYYISPSFRLELSLALGYFASQYNHYHQKAQPNGTEHLVEHYRSNLNWVGPTKANVSLVWIPQINLKNKKGARR